MLTNMQFIYLFIYFQHFAIIWDSVSMDDSGLSALQMLSSAVTKMLKAEGRFEDTPVFANILWCSPWMKEDMGLNAVAVMSTFPLDFLFLSQ